MLSKTIILMVFYTVTLKQFAESKGASECYSCNSSLTCLSPAKRYCDQRTANNTLLELAKYLSYRGNQTALKFDCLNAFITFYDQEPNSVQIKGCIYSNLNVCRGIPEDFNIKTTSCTMCSNDLCNASSCFAASLLTIMLTTFILGFKSFYC